jgi:tetratricopeptide (TPR) repeat protein
MSRIDALKGFLEEDPNDSFSRYALAMELARIADLDQAIAQFETVRNNDADYVATYYQLARTYERAGRPDDAARTYRDGIAVATRMGDSHSRDELAEALNLLTGQE